MKPAAKYSVIALVVVLVIGAAGAFWFLRDDSPDEVDIDAAAEGVAERSTTTAANGATTDPGDVTGTWTVDTETGEFDYESATGTFAGIRIEEELASIGSTTAVGRTGDVSGTVVIDGTSVTSADFEVDVNTITTNESRRDNKVQQALETSQFPTATFSLTQPIELGDDATNGDTVSVTGVGELTVHGVTKAVEIPIQAKLVGDTIVMTASMELTFSDYGVEVPESPIVLSVSDVGTLEMQLLLVRS